MLTEVLEQRLKEAASEAAAPASVQPLPASDLIEASGLAVLNFRKRRLSLRRRWTKLHLGFLHSDELVLVEEDRKQAQIVYSGDNLRECLDELQSRVDRLRSGRYRSDDPLPTINSVIKQVAEIVRDRKDARSVLAI